MIRLDNSALGLYKNCKRAFYYAHVRGLFPKTFGNALFDGSVFHQAVADFMTTKIVDFKKIETEYTKLVDQVTNPEDVIDIEDRQAKMIGMLTSYISKYESDHTKYKIIAVEEKIEYRLPNNSDEVVIYGTPDTWLEEIDTKNILLLENKTTSRIDSSYLKRLALDAQLSMYYWLYNMKFGRYPDGIVYNIATKTQSYRKKNETLEQFTQRMIEYYQKPKKGEDENISLYREYLHRTPQQIEGFSRQLQVKIDEIVLLMHNKNHKYFIDFFYQNDRYCTAYNNQCAYMPLCIDGEENCLAAYNQNNERLVYNG